MATRHFLRPDSPLAAEFWEKGRSESCPIYNMHCHLGAYHSMFLPRVRPGDMLRGMDAAGVRLACFAHFSAATTGHLGNRPAVEVVRAFPDRLRAYLWVNPHYPDLVERELEQYDRFSDVFIGIKLHPDAHKVPLTDDAYRLALEFANERGLPVLCHTYDGSNFNGPAQVRAVAEKYTNLQFLMGHSLKANWQAAADIALQFPHVWLELTGVLGQWGAVEYLCRTVGSERLLFGTDLPWYGVHQGIGHLLCADITDEDVHNICHRNAERLLGLA